MIEHSELIKLVSYDPITGEFHRLFSKRTDTIGNKIGIKNKKSGYIYVAINGTNYIAHRLAWFYVHGAWPVDQIDHINRDRADNRIANIRESTNAKNQVNRNCRNQHGLKGIAFHPGKRIKHWSAGARIQGKDVFLGYFLHKEEAHKAYLAAITEGYGEFAAP